MTDFWLNYQRPPLEGRGSVWDKFLRAVLNRRVPGLNIIHAIAGRGAAKTYHSMIAFAHLAFDPQYCGAPFVWSEATDKELDDIFWPKWRALVPGEGTLWHQGPKNRKVIIPGGADIHLMGRMTTTGQNREPFRGPDWIVAVYDEAAHDPTNKAWKTLVLGVRGACKAQKIIITSSTPLLGSWYQHVVQGEGHDPVFYATSFDNPVEDPDAIERAKQDLSPEEYKQEVLGQWVPLGGRAWASAVLDKDWPDGNMHPHVWDPSMPFTLSCDIGNQSAWQIWQHPAIYDDWGRPNGYLDVLVAQYTPNHGNTEQITCDITTNFGKPTHVIVGADVNTDNSATGESSRLVMQSAGWDCPVVWPKPPRDQKWVQYLAMNRLIYNQRKHRQMCISKGLITKEPHHRGLEVVLEADTWPERAIRGEFLPKDKKTKHGNALEDSRDAALYFSIIMHPVDPYKQTSAQ
jgi:hypothetical protein